MDQIVFTKPILAVIKTALAELYTHTTLVNLFETYDFECNPIFDFSNKLNKVSSYIDHQNWSDSRSTNKMLQLLTQVYNEYGHLTELDEGTQNNSIFQMKNLHKVLSKNSIIWDGSSYNYLLASKIEKIENIKSTDLSSIKVEISRALSNADHDPADAMTAAENIFVATCKKILHETKNEIASSDSPQQLFNKTLSVLKILPDNISDSNKGSEFAKKVLRSMSAAIQGLSELRNLYADTHGKVPNYRGLEARHARLMIGLSESISIFLLETYIKNAPKSEKGAT